MSGSIERNEIMKQNNEKTVLQTVPSFISCNAITEAAIIHYK